MSELRRFYAPPQNFNDQTVKLEETETRHLRDVLRLRAGDEASVFDGEGREFRCSIAAIGKRDTSLEIINEISPASAESDLQLTIAATVLPGEKYDLVVQKSVELGAVALIPLITKRCEVKLKDTAKRLERWRRIAFEAAKQCGRAKLMAVDAPMSFDELLESAAGDHYLLFSERDGAGFETITVEKKITAVFGPKGGWEDQELQAARERDIRIITFGGRVLRAETAVISISAILQHRFGDFN